ncbi:MAG: hypothetical protein ACYTGQ_12550 [Planctomycetota bacterium]|jgi:hypothetical protein
MTRTLMVLVSVVGLGWATGCEQPSAASRESVREAQGAPTQMENKEAMDVRRQGYGTPGVIK